MTDRERTLKWLECCGGYNDELEHIGCTSDCPYWENENCCNPSQPFKDTLAMLKEQEAKTVLSMEKRSILPVNTLSGVLPVNALSGFCPKCNHTLIYGLNDQFCGFCGQKVKWE